MMKRAIATCTALVFATASCGETVNVAASSLREKNVDRLNLILTDQTVLTMYDAHLGSDDVVRGVVVGCHGDGCTQARNDGVSLARVEKMTKYVPNPASTAVAIVGVTLVVGGTIALGFALASAKFSSGSSGMGVGGSCPRMYSWNGTDWQLDSGTFGGSMFSASQLTDHDLLEHLTPDGATLRMRLQNELPETEHTDAIALRVVDHPAGTHVVPTSSGKLLGFRDPAAPLVATDLRGRDARDLVATRDAKEWTSDPFDRDPQRREDARDGLLLTFAKPVHAKRAKLWVTARNTPWAGDMLQYLLSLVGPALPGWFASMDRDATSRTAFTTFLDREGSLFVHARTSEKWDQRGVVGLVGPEILKDVALEIPVEDLAGDRLEVRLDAPVAFWSIDSVSVSFDDDEPVTVKELHPRSAIADDGKDVTAELLAIDHRYYSTVTGNRAELTFDAPPPPAAGQARSYVLVSTGYYVPDAPPDSHADVAELARLTSDPNVASQQALAFLNVGLARRLLR